jgi:hypothetical protein
MSRRARRRGRSASSRLAATKGSTASCGGAGGRPARLSFRPSCHPAGQCGLRVITGRDRRARPSSGHRERTALHQDFSRNGAPLCSIRAEVSAPCPWTLAQSGPTATSRMQRGWRDWHDASESTPIGISASLSRSATSVCPRRGGGPSCCNLANKVGVVARQGQLHWLDRCGS